MKKILISAILLFFTLILIPTLVSAANANLATNANVKYDYKLNGTNTSRLTVTFNLAESIDLSQENTNIIVDYYIKNTNGELIPIRSDTTGQIYAKDKSWAGYLNSYDNHGVEYKYSTGTANDTRYSNNIPVGTTLATQITNSTKLDIDWNSSVVFAIKITATRNDKSGEEVIAYSDGSKSTVKKIHAPIAPVVDVSANTGIKLESTSQLPASTQLVAHKIEDNTVYNEVSNILTEVKDFVVYKITLESSGVKIQPDGKVRINIPIPEDYNNSNVSVYRIEEDGSTREYNVSTVKEEGIDYATFETEHFSTYVLAEVESGAKDNTPKTGGIEIIYYGISALLLVIIGILIVKKKTR